jgi:hypothetical protein
LNDRFEVEHFMNPLIDDTGVDFDNDTLTYDDEIAAGTNPWNPDTDFDGLSDSSEIYTYQTSPIVQDSDADGFKDGEEITVKYRCPLWFKPLP